jgi:hypothetical protein
VQPEHVNWGALEYDGPAAVGIDGGKPALQWYFGGVAYPITKAIRINYTYVRRWDGSNAVVTTAIYLGFQDGLSEYVVPSAIPLVARPTATFQQRVGDLGPYGGFSTNTWASDAGVLASEAAAVIARSFAYDDVNLNTTFNKLLRDELGLVADLLLETPLPVDVDGPAQNYDSHKPFEYTVATLQNEPELYSQVLFWYFGGKPWRLTKAMRIPLDAAISSRLAGQSVVVRAQTKDLVAQQAARTQYIDEKARVVRANREARAAGRAAEERAVPAVPDTLVPGGNALFLGYAGPDPGG